MGSCQSWRITELSWGGKIDRYFFEEDAAIVVTQFTNVHQVVMEIRHYLAAPDGELWEEQVS